jgi:hypothetical protein
MGGMFHTNYCWYKSKSLMMIESAKREYELS